MSSETASPDPDHASAPGPASRDARLQSLLKIPLCADLLADNAWEQPLAEVDWNRDGWSLAQTIAAIAIQQDSEGQTARAAQLVLVACLASMHLQVGGDELLTPRYITPERWSAGLCDMDANDFAAVKAIALNTRVTWIRARCADVMLASAHAHGRDRHALAALGAEAYLQLVREAEATTAEVDINTVNHLRRALALGWPAKKKDDLFQHQVWSSFMALFRRTLRGPFPGMADRYVTELLDRPSDHASEAAELLEAAARGTEIDEDIDSEIQHRLLSLARRLWDSEGQTERARGAGRQAAEALVVRAGSAQSAAVKAIWLAQAVAELRRYHGDADRVKWLQSELANVRLRIADELGEIKLQVDVGFIHEWVQEHIASADYQLALLKIAFAALDHPDPELERHQAIGERRGQFFGSFFGSTHLDAEGAPLRSQRPFDAHDPVHVETAAIERVCDTRYPRMLAPLITIALRQLSERFSSSFDDVLSVVRYSPATPHNHAWQIARGLYAGLQFRWDDAAINLIPMVEAIVRAELKRHDVDTRVTNDVDGENERSLTQLLELDAQLGILSKGLNFELKALMTHPAGANLRNRYAHGLMSDKELASPATLAVWWVVLRFVLRPYAELASLVDPGSRETSEASVNHPK
ncbi:TPA: DUF4209 domain-containing protein [Stenotrophomonas maltophilia]